SDLDGPVEVLVEPPLERRQLVGELGTDDRRERSLLLELGWVLVQDPKLRRQPELEGVVGDQAAAHRVNRSGARRKEALGVAPTSSLVRARSISSAGASRVNVMATTASGRAAPDAIASSRTSDRRVVFPDPALAVMMRRFMDTSTARRSRRSDSSRNPARASA